MCRNLVLLARNDQRQLIFTCEHQMMHMVHQSVTIVMSRQSYTQLMSLIDTAEINTPYARTLGFHIFEARDGHINLWIGSGGLHLSHGDFLALRTLMEVALHRLQHIHWPLLEEKPFSSFLTN